MSDGARFTRPSLAKLPASDPTPSFETIAGDLGLDRIAILGLNEGVDGPFPSALAAISATLPRLNRYPGRGSYELGEALAVRHGVRSEQVFVAAGADSVIGYACQATLDPGHEIVTAWPSFPSFVRDAEKRDAVPVCVPLAAGRIDLAAMLAAVTPRTRLAFVATPNNPTGLPIEREDLLAFVRKLPDHVLPVIDEAYFDYLDPADRLDAVADVLGAGHDALVLRTFSKLYGLAGLRVGYGVGPAAVVAAMRKVQRGYDVGALAQAAALASLSDAEEVVRRRDANREAVRVLTAILADRGHEPLAGSVTNFVLVDVGSPADAAADALLRAGVAVQSGAPFGAPTSLRITTGAPPELELLASALELVRVGDGSGLTAR